MFEEEIIKLLKKAGISASKEQLEVPPRKEFGDFSFPVFNLAKEQKKNANEVAKNIYDKINDYPLEFMDYNIFRQRVAKESGNKGDPRIFTIYSGDLLLWPVPDFTAITGTQTHTTAFKLRDAAATFITKQVQVGMLATDIVAAVTALITNVDSEIALSIDTDIFTGVETYSIAKCLHVDYVKMITAATDAAGALDVPDKYEKVVIDGILEFAYLFDPELGAAADQRARFKDGLNSMIRENQQAISENKRPVSHRLKHMMRSDVDRRDSLQYPLDTENI
jgi:hypothetical protein